MLLRFAAPEDVSTPKTPLMKPNNVPNKFRTQDSTTKVSTSFCHLGHLSLRGSSVKSPEDDWGGESSREGPSVVPQMYLSAKPELIEATKRDFNVF